MGVDDERTITRVINSAFLSCRCCPKYPLTLVMMCLIACFEDIVVEGSFSELARACPVGSRMGEVRGVGEDCCRGCFWTGNRCIDVEEEGDRAFFDYALLEESVTRIC